MTDEDIVLDYARRMFERQRVPLPPLGFTVDWADQPSRHKLYLGTTRLPLPSPFDAMPPTTLDDAVSSTGEPATDTRPGLDVLSSALACYGLSGRRTEPNWNEDSTRKLQTHYAVWSRPTPCGGGMYPAESYLAVGDDGPLPAGVYHYATAHHSLDRLSVGSRAGALADATGVEAPLYLVGTLRFWKNAFKYNSFSYHVVTQDIGALLGSWRLVFAAHRIAIEPVLWFDEEPVNDVLGVDGRTEAAFVVVPLGPRASASARTGSSGHTSSQESGHKPVEAKTQPLLQRGQRQRVERHRVWEKSERVRSFPLVEQVHAAATVGSRPRPSPETNDVRPPNSSGSEASYIQWSSRSPAERAAAAATDLDLSASLRNRRSSFGTLCAHPPLDLADLGWALSISAGVGVGGTDVTPAPRTRPWTRLWVMANHVDGLQQRAYAYDHQSGRLITGSPVDFAELQRHYALTNYNVIEAAAVVVVTGWLEPLVRRYGGPGYRMLSIEVGQHAQGLYLAATARGLGIGAVLGIDNLAADSALGIDGTDETSMLFFLLGHQRRPSAGYDHTLRYPRPTALNTAAQEGANTHD